MLQTLDLLRSKSPPHWPASIFPFPSKIVISYVLPAFWFLFVERVSKGTEKVQAKQVERLLLFSPPSYPHWPTHLQLRYIRRWAPFAAVSNMRWSGVRIRMTYIAAVGYNMIPPGMHRYASHFTLSNVFLVSSFLILPDHVTAPCVMTSLTIMVYIQCGVRER